VLDSGYPESNKGTVLHKKGTRENWVLHEEKGQAVLIWRGATERGGGGHATGGGSPYPPLIRGEPPPEGIEPDTIRPRRGPIVSRFGASEEEGGGPPPLRGDPLPPPPTL
jgi:hypothetical protein